MEARVVQPGTCVDELFDAYMNCLRYAEAAYAAIQLPAIELWCRATLLDGVEIYVRGSRVAAVVEVLSAQPSKKA